MRPTAFRLGLLAGVGVFLAMAWWVNAAYRAAVGPDLGYNVQVNASGAALTRAGARQLEVRTTYGLIMRQVCNGACDDLEYRVKSPDNSYRVAVLDKKGGCISCEDGLYVSSGFGGSLARFDVRDDEGALVRAGYYEVMADGSLKRQEPPPPAQ